MPAAYTILDEPRPGALSHLAVNPYWPLLALMLGGAWLGWPWFVLNAFAIGSATKTKEIALAVAGLAGSAVLVAGILALDEQGRLTASSARYVLIAPMAWKLAAGYFAHSIQSRSFGLFRYFARSERSGLFPLLAATFWLRPALLGALKNALFALLVLQ